MINGSSSFVTFSCILKTSPLHPHEAENPSLSPVCATEARGSRIGEHSSWGWAYYLDAFSSYRSATWLPKAFTMGTITGTPKSGISSMARPPEGSLLRPPPKLLEAERPKSNRGSEVKLHKGAKTFYRFALADDACIAPPQRFPRFRLHSHFAATTTESLLLSFPLATKMFRFAGLSLTCPWMSSSSKVDLFGNLGSMLIFNSPEAFCRLLRPSSSLGA
ncbi:hypothetical protein IFM89_001047 [Coptis chinensis]|uniref:Uncharacterized protein n=1 Tax=Coptis chinensis TaxID=261450 RepID=A0A835HAS5_9MAGN|nr:hypothetical protein IFM89_001047 [Coptis chinensis]